MKNKFLSPTKIIAGLTILAWILGTTKEALAQNLANRNTNTPQTENTNWVTSNANSLAYSDPLAFVQKNIIKYFWTNSDDINKLKSEGYSSQDLQNYINLLNKKIGNWMIKDHVNDIIRQYIIANVPDTRSQIEGIINLLESDIFWDDMSFKKIFWDIFMFEEKNYYIFELVSDWWVAHRKRLIENIEQMNKNIEQMNKNIEQMNKNIEQMNKNIEQMNKDIEEASIRIENIMKFISPDMVKTDPKVKELVLKRQQKYQRLNQTPKDSHIIALFNALK